MNQIQLIKGKKFEVQVTNSGLNKRTLHLIKDEIYLTFNEDEIIEILKSFKDYEENGFIYDFKGVQYILTIEGENKIDDLIDIEFERQFQNSELENPAINVSYHDVFEEFLNHYDNEIYIKNKRKLQCL